MNERIMAVECNSMYSICGSISTMNIEFEELRDIATHKKKYFNAYSEILFLYEKWILCTQKSAFEYIKKNSIKAFYVGCWAVYRLPFNMLSDFHFISL